MQTELRKLSWKYAATGGLYIGLIFTVMMLVGYVQNRENDSYSLITAVTEFIAMVAVIYIYAKKMSEAYGESDLSYGKSIGFILKMGLFGGIVAGVAQVVNYKVLDPEWYETLIDTTLLNFSVSGGDNFAEIMGTLRNVYLNPLFIFISGVFGMVFYTGLIGIFVAAVTKKTANPFTGSRNKDQNED